MRYENQEKIYKELLEVLEKYKLDLKNDQSFLFSLINNKFKVDINFKESDKNINIESLFLMLKDAIVKKYIFNKEGCYHKEQIKPATKKNYYAISSSQERMFIQNKLNQDSSLLTVNAIIPQKEAVNLKLLQSAITEVVDRHEILRTKFKEVNGKPIQKICDKSVVKLKVHNFKSTSNTKKDKKRKEEIIEDIIKTPFNLSEDPPLRITLLRSQGASDDVLIVSLHHIASDQWSMRIFFKELFEIYNALLNKKKPNLPKLPIQYKDYAEWEQSKENQKRLAKQKKYWLTRLGDNPPISNLPLDYPRESILEYKKGYVCDYLDNKTLEKLQKTANDHNSSIFMVLFAIFNIYISRLTGKEEIIVGTSTTLRNSPDLAKLIGYFSNDIPIKTTLNNNNNFRELLIQTRKNILNDYENSDYPLEKIIDDLSFSRDLRNIRLFNSVLKINEYNKDRSLPKEAFNSENLHSGKSNNQATDNDWGIILETYKDKARLSGEYNANVLKEETVKAWMSDLVHLTKQIAKDPEKKISDYEIVSPQTKQKLLKDFNNTDKEMSLVKAPHHYFEEKAKKTPNEVAAEYENKKISYKELNEEANKLSNQLIEKGLKHSHIVAVDISSKHYLNIPKIVLAIHKAGGACLIIDREHPKERIKYILKKSKTKLIITDNTKDSYKLEKGIEKIDITKKIDKYSKIIKKQKGHKLTGIKAQDIAFILFTSGTTGVPKGIKVTARGMVNEAYNKVDQLDIKKINAIPLNFSLLYTPAIEFISTSLVLGKKLVIYPKAELYDAYAVMKRTDKSKIKFIWTTPSVLNSYLQIIEKDPINKKKIPLKNLSILNLTGEKTPLSLAQRFYSKYKHIQLTCDYGGSEPLTCSNYNIPNSKDLLKIKDGKALKNQKIYVLDKNQKLLPIGAKGEIYCSGYSLADGYLGDSKQTKEKFLPHPFIKGETIYRSGDLGRIDHEGNIETKGRVDDQVKIRGYRVAFSEISTSIKELPEVQDVVIMPWKKQGEFDLSLVCYYSVKEKRNISVEEIKSSLERKVPNHMIPKYFVKLKNFPLNQNGKLDRKNLPEPKEKDTVKSKYIAPQTISEKKLAKIWQEILKVDKVGIYDNFFNLGGHSLKAIQVLSRINNQFKIDLGLKPLFEYPVLRDLSQRIVTEQKDKNKATPIIIPKAPKKKYYPLSYAQKRMFVLYKLEPDSSFYNINEFIKINGPLNIPALKRALDIIIKRHESLRTNFKEMGGEPVQIVNPNAKVVIEEFDIRNIEDEIERESRKEMIDKITKTPFVLETETLIRLVILRQKEEENTLFITMHHIISDVWTINFLKRELAIIYNALLRKQTPELPELLIQYKDYATWEQSEDNTKRLKRQEDFWLKELEGKLPILNLPIDKIRPQIQTYVGNSEKLVLDKKTTLRLKELSQQTNSTLFALLFTINNVFLQKVSGQNDLILGTFVSNRTREEVQDIMGCLMNNLAVRSDMSQDPRFDSFLDLTKNKIINAINNGDYPFELLIEKLKVDREMSHSPIFNVLFQIDKNPFEVAHFDNLKINTGSSLNFTTKFDLKVRAKETFSDNLILLFEYNTDLFNKKTIQTFLGIMHTLIKEITKNPQKKLSEYEIVNKEEKKILLNKFNDTKEEYPKNKTLDKLFEEQAKRTPSKIAVEAEGEKLSYKELNQKANQLASFLSERFEKHDNGKNNKKKNQEKNNVIGIATNRNLDLAIATIAVHKAGGVCLLIDQSYPDKRIEVILKDAKTEIVLASNDNLKKKVAYKNINNIININSKEIQKYGNSDNVNNKPRKVTDLAYIVYTSGSTGVPKGVSLSHKNIVNSIYQRRRIMGLKQKDIFCLSVLSGFVAMTFKFYNPLISGSKLLIYSEEIVKNAPKLFAKVEKDKVSVLDVSLQNLSLYLNHIEENKTEKQALKNLRIVLPVGEKLDKKTANNFLNEYNHINIFTTYGMTEFAGTIFENKIVYQKNKVLEKIVEGKTPQNSQTYILDKNLNLLPTNTKGDVYFSGDSLSEGYFNNKEKTNEVFLPHPFIKNKKIFKTGDIGRFDEEGSLEIIGRSDNQVKIRGYRVELNEIESIIGNHPAIKKVIVLKKEKNNDGKIKNNKYSEEEYLVAYYTTKKNKKVTSDSLREHSKNQLPDYMIPSYFIHLKEFPLNSSGKLDRLNLPEPTEKDLDKQKYQAPQTETEKEMAKIWQEVLNIEKVGLNDNFFNLGGHSLKAIQLLTLVNQKFEVKIALKNFFELPVLEAFVKVLLKMERSKTEKIEKAKGNLYNLN